MFVASLAVLLLGTAGFARADKLNAVSRLETREDGATTVVTIRGSTVPTFTVYKLEKPERVVVDVANAKLTQGTDPALVNSWAVGQVAAQALGGQEAAVVRVMVGFARPATYHVKAVGNDVVVTVLAREPKPAAAVSVVVDDSGTKAALAAADKAKQDAASARAEADQARADAEARKGELERQRAEMDKMKLKAGAESAEAARVKLEADQRKAEAAASLEASTRARAEAEEKKAQAAALTAEAARAKADADKRNHDALAHDAEAQKTKAEAAAELAQARQQMAEADGRMKQADKAVADAETRRKDAQAQAQAADKRRAEADKLARETETRAKAAEAAGDSDAAKRRQEAEVAAAKAEKRRQEAESATAQAEAQRKAADDKRREAEGAVAQAQNAKLEADRQLKDAEGSRDRAKKEAALAEKARGDAQLAREKEEERAKTVEKKRAQEEESTRVAAASRVREEAATERAADARKLAEQKKIEAERALAQVEDARGKAEAAKRDADGRREQAAKAAALADEVAKDRTATAEQVKKTKEDAARFEQQRIAAEGELATRKRELADNEARAKEVAGARTKASADAEKARHDVDDAKKALAEEEGKRSAVAAVRATEERRLIEARKAREVEEAKLAALELKRKSAEDRENAKAVAMAKSEAAAQAKADAAAAARAKAKPETETVAVAVAKPVPVVVAPVTPVAVAQKGGKVRVRDVDYVDRDAFGRVVLDFGGPAQPKIIVASGKQAIMEVVGAEIPRELERSLDTSEYDGPVVAVSSYRDPRDGTKMRVVVDLAANTKSSLSHVGNTWYWDFERTGKKRGATVATGTPVKTRSTSYAPPVVGGYGVATTPVMAQTVGQVGPNRAVISRQRIDLDIKDADIHNLMRLLAQAGNVDIVVPDDVRATVTVRLTHVYWRQAMEVILKSKGLWYDQDGSIIRVAQRKDLDAEEEAARARDKAKVQEERPETELFTLNYAKASEMQAQVIPLQSPRGKVVIDDRTNSLVITDVAGNRTAMLALMRRLDTQTPQIQIEARVVEARSTWQRQIGVQWGFNANASTAGGNPTGLVFPSSVAVGGGADDAQAPTGGLSSATPGFAVNLPAATGAGEGGALGFTFGSVGGNFNVSLRLSAAEDQGTIRIISAPKITVLNNRPASIKQGVSIPISVVSAAGVQTQFVPADLSLDVLPHVSQRDCSIQMDVNVKKNEADFVNTGARGDPSLLTKEAKTSILIADGETTVIGGIYTRNTGLSFKKVPWFADIPIIGWFFRSRTETDQRTELLIFLTPRITNKASLHCEPPVR